MPFSLAILLAAGDAGTLLAQPSGHVSTATGIAPGALLSETRGRLLTRSLSVEEEGDSDLFPLPLGEGEGEGPEAAAGVAVSPGARMTAILFPTGTSSPTEAVTFVKMPEAGASISTVALSVSISINGSPLVTDWPSALSQLSSVPFSCATPSAGMITSVAMSCCSLRKVKRRGPL